MHVEYLRGLFLPNALAHWEWQLDGSPVNLGDIRVLIFNVRAVQDHVAPWRSVSKLQALTDAEQTFVLTGGGHNVGIVNPPGQPKANYRIRTWQAGDRLLTPDEWLDATTVERGSWWTLWSTGWLATRADGWHRRRWALLHTDSRRTNDAAPGRYVRARDRRAPRIDWHQRE